MPEHVYGYCPYCGEPGKTRERRPNGNDKCVNGHVYPSKNALPIKPHESVLQPVPSIQTLPTFGVLVVQLDPSDLDEAVHSMKSLEATNLNSHGTEQQLAYLRGKMDDEEYANLILGIIDNDPPSCPSCGERGPECACNTF